MAKAPPPGAATRTQTDDQALSFKYDGDTYTLRFGEIAATLTKECRQVTGHSPMQIMAAVHGNAMTADLDVLVAFMWLCKRQAGEPVDYDGLMESVTYDSLASWEMTDKHAEPEPDSPEV